MKGVLQQGTETVLLTLDCETVVRGEHGVMVQKPFRCFPTYSHHHCVFWIICFFNGFFFPPIEPLSPPSPPEVRSFLPPSLLGFDFLLPFVLRNGVLFVRCCVGSLATSSSSLESALGAIAHSNTVGFFGFF